MLKHLAPLRCLVSRALTPLRAVARRGLLAVLLVSGLLLTPTTQAGVSTSYATLSRLYDGGYGLNADFRLQLPQGLQDAINYGTPVSFYVEFEMRRPRWYWSDETLVSAEREHRITFNSLTREYRVATGSELRRFANLSDALVHVSRTNLWRVVEPSEYKANQTYAVRVRYSLAQSKLPRVYQLSAVTRRDWALDSGWYTIQFTPR